MPRGGHRGGIFPVSGLPWGMNGVYKKRGLYHNKREDILVPRWSYHYKNTNKSHLPDGSAKSFAQDVDMAWPIFDPMSYELQYAKNEKNYLLPAMLATSSKVKEYILNNLEPSYKKIFSGIGMHYVNSWANNSEINRNSQAFNHLIPAHIYDILYQTSKRMKNVSNDDKKNQKNDDNVESSLDSFLSLPNIERGKIRRLYKLVIEADIWRIKDRRSYGKSGKNNQTNQFPYVNEDAVIVRDLQLSEIFYSRSNHRVRNRRHPIWIAKMYKNKNISVPYLYRRRIAREEMQQKELGIWRGKSYVENN